MVAPASAFIGSQNIETKAETMYEIACNAQETVNAIIARIEADETISALLDESDWDEINEQVALANGDGAIALNVANDYLYPSDPDSEPDYEAAIESAREALTIFRDSLRSIHVILFEAGVEIGELADPQALQEAIDRSQDRIDELEDLLQDSDLLAMLTEAQGLLDEAQTYLDSENLDAAKESLQEANRLISQVCQDLREIAQELNPQRITNYCEGAFRHRETFRERFGQAENEGFDVNGFLEQYGYQNEEDFMARFQEMIQNAQNAEDIEDVLDDLEAIGQLIRQMDQSLTQEMSHHRAQYGQTGVTFGHQDVDSGYGQNGVASEQGISNGYGQNIGEYNSESSSNQMGFGSGH